MLARKTVLVFATRLLNSLLGFAATVAIARFMGPVPMGTIGYVLSIIGLFAFFSDLGFSATHVKRISETEDVAENTGAFFILKTGLTALLLIMLCVTPLIGQWVGYEPFDTSEQFIIYYILTSMYVFKGLQSLFLITFNAKQEVTKSSIALLSGSIITVILKITIAILGLDVITLALTYLIQDILVFGFGFVLFRGYQIRWPQFSHIRNYLTFAAPVMVNFILLSIILNLDKVLLGKFWGVTEVGYYVAVIGIVNLLDHISKSAMTLFLPQSSEDIHLNRTDRAVTRLIVVEKYLLLTVTPMIMFIVFYRDPITRFILGEQFSTSIPVLGLLAIQMFWKTYMRPYTNLIYAYNEPHHSIWVHTIELVLLVIINLILVPKVLFGIQMFGLGSLGVALSGVIRLTIITLIFVTFVRRRFQIPNPWSGTWFIVSGIVAYGIMLFTQKIFGWNHNFEWHLLWHSSFLMLLSTMIFVGILMFVKVVQLADLYVFIKIINPIKLIIYAVGELRQRPVS